MAIGLVHERVNKEVYDRLTQGVPIRDGSQLSDLLTNDIFPTIINKVGDYIRRPDVPTRNYTRFKRPLSEVGAITEYLMANMTKADDAVSLVTGEEVHEYVVNNPDIQARYAVDQVRANYPLTLGGEKWLDAVDNMSLSTVANLTGIAMQKLYDGIEHDHDAMIPAMFGPLYAGRTSAQVRELPAYTGEDIETYTKTVFAALTQGVRDMTQWQRQDLNGAGVDMVDSVGELTLVSFSNPAGTTGTFTVFDIIGSQLAVGAVSRATGLANYLGIGAAYEMPSPGLIPNSIARAYGFPNFPGMQTADMRAGAQTPPYPEVKLALVGVNALNVGLKRTRQDSNRSARAHADFLYILKVIELMQGLGQVLFFTVPSPTP